MFAGELQGELLRLSVDHDDVCVVGSAVMGILGFCEPRDLDIVVTVDLRRLLAVTDEPQRITPNVEVVGRNWAGCVGISDNQLIRDPRYHFRAYGLKWVRPEVMLAVLSKRRRPKNRSSIRNLEALAARRADWDWDLLKELVFLGGGQTAAAAAPSFGHRLWRWLERLVRDPRAAMGAFARVGRRLRRRSSLAGVTVRPSSVLSLELSTRMSTGALLGRQYEAGRFCRYDVLLRYLAVEALVTGSREWIPQYQTMQRKRIGHDTIDDLAILVESVRARGLLPKHPVPVTRSGRLLDGAHRLACALYFGASEVPVLVESVGEASDFGREWFEEHAFDAELIAALDRVKRELLEREGTWFALLVWPPAEPFLAEIRALVEARYRIVFERRIRPGSRLPDFVREVYSTDDISSWKIELKIGGMLAAGDSIHLIAIEIADPHYRSKGTLQRPLSTEAERLKDRIRRNHRSDIPGYFYDIICHIGDNPEHNRNIFAVARRYGEPH